MNLSLNSVKLKHLEYFTEHGVDIPKVMTEILGYTNKGVLRYFRFTGIYNRAVKLSEEVLKIDIEKIGLQPSSNIKRPTSIDYLSFRARMELESYMLNPNNDEAYSLIAMTVAIATYGSNIGGVYDSDSISFKRYKERIMNQPILCMLGLFNWVKSSINESNIKWSQLFKDVEDTDPDFLQAGGHMMDRFNVLNTIKAVCTEFNVTYDEAWQMSYIITQTSSLSNATSAFLQSRMSKIKENRMKTQRAGGK